MKIRWNKILFLSVLATASWSVGTIVACSTPGGTKPEPTKQTSVTIAEDKINEPAMRFIAVGDTGKGTDQQRLVGRAMAEKCKVDGCDFLLFLGDNIYEYGITSPQDPQMKSKFEEPYKDINVPFYVALGNHDYAETDWKRAQNEVDYTKFSKKWYLPQHYYHFEKQLPNANVLFGALDTQPIHKDYDQNFEKQTDYFSKVFSVAATWKVAFGHHPYISNGLHGNAKGKMRTILENSVCPNVDVYFAGHDHNREVPQPVSVCKSFLVISGAGAETRPFSGSQPDLFASTEVGFSYVTVSRSKFRIDMVKVLADGKYLTDFTHTLSK